ncbi:hypothetical protein HOLleu_04447 [Holothuria leucospilota]|uniref:Integrase zinc-binding domain-containing protein n=1 Tax=Holothuria leucospilota TaxID=206669 RepID=A0A9Q1HKT9_HOLLE|nr:hypothetical protein HOLleu_04447 [Holothuria leucospilota]
MTSLARMYVFWSKINQDIEEMVRSCSVCSELNYPVKAPLNPWIYPCSPGESVHVDFAGPFPGKCTY